MSVAPVDRIRLQKAAVDEGFGLPRPDDGDWLAFGSLGAPAELRLSRLDSVYVVAIDHAGVAQQLEGTYARWAGRAPEGFRAYEVADTEALQELVANMFRLSRALPEAPLQVFQKQTRNMPRTTEADRLVVQRVGQDIFRDALLDYWSGTCAVTAVANPRLLRASHIIPWARCEDDAERLNVFNGLLLAAHLDAAFDAGLISFGDQGAIVMSPTFAESDRAALGIVPALRLRQLTDEHRQRLAWHRENIFMPIASST